MQNQPTPYTTTNRKQLLQLINSPNVDHALGAESLLYEHAKRPDTVENFSKTMQPAQLPMYQHGLKLRSMKTYVINRKKIGFYLVSGSLLAHTNVLATYTKNAKKFIPKVYVIGNANDKLAPHLGCEVEWLPLLPSSVHTELPNRLARDGICAFGAVSCPLFASFFSGLAPAPKVFWWSYKYQSLKVPGLDAYISTNQAKEGWWDGPNGNKWYNTPGAFDKLYDPSKERIAAEVRKDLGAPQKVILGVVGRTEKLDNEVYARTIGRILDGTSNTVFCYACREKPKTFGPLEAKFGNRVVYLGWVDTLVATQVFDIYLDSFPLGSGQVFCEAAAAGKPVVSLANNLEYKQSSILAQLNTLGYEKDLHELGARYTPQTYYELADDLIEYPKLRAEYGSTLKNWVLTTKMNVGTFVDSFERIMEEMIG